MNVTIVQSFDLIQVHLQKSYYATSLHSSAIMPLLHNLAHIVNNLQHTVSSGNPILALALGKDLCRLSKSCCSVNVETTCSTVLHYLLTLPVYQDIVNFNKTLLLVHITYKPEVIFVSFSVRTRYEPHSLDRSKISYFKILNHKNDATCL